MKRLARFFVSVKKEMKKVRWTGKKEMIKLSTAAIAIICFFMVFFSMADGILSIIVRVFS